MLFVGLVLTGSFAFGQVIYNNQQSNTISGVQTFTQDIIVDFKTELIITGTVKMGNGTKITVNNGGRLVINGGTIESSEPLVNGKQIDHWYGIEVFGHDHYTTHPVWGLAYIGTYGGLNATGFETAGVVVLKNGALVQHAETGVWAGNRNNPPVNPRNGGIVISINSTITNCKTRVRIDKYLVKKNASYFRNTTFSGTYYEPDWVDPNDHSQGWNSYTSDPYADISLMLNDVIDVNVLGCKFIGPINSFMTYCDDPAISWDPCLGEDDGLGIVANDATFLVDDYYSGLNQTVLYHSEFRRYRKAIVIKDLCLNSYRPIIRNTLFVGNFEAVNVKGSNNVQIHHNRMFFWHDYIGSDDRPHGIYLEGCTGYNIENNLFDGEVPNSGVKISQGVVVTNSGNDGDLIYKNDFLDLVHGAHSQNDNRGLEFDCNTHDFNFPSSVLPEPYIDFVATVDGSNPNSGLANQGSPARPVYNTFEHFCSGNLGGFGEADFFIDGIPPLIYNYPDGVFDQDPLCHNVIENPVIVSGEPGNECPDKLLPGGTRPYVVVNKLPPLKADYIAVLNGPQGPFYQDELDEVKFLFVRAMNEHIGDFLNTGDAQGAVNYLLTEDFDFARRKLVPLQIQIEDYLGAEGTMNMLDQTILENKKFKDFYTVFSEVHSTDKKFEDLTSSQILVIQDVANSATRISTQAQNWLEMHFDGDYSLIKHPVVIPVGNNNTEYQSQQGNSPIVELIKFYPNPSQSSINFTISNIGEVVMRDMNGRVVLKSLVTNGRLNIESVDAGVYFIEFSNQVPERLIVID